MAQHPDILILGGGVIGLTTAYFLCSEGVRVTVVDQGPIAKASSWAGAGIIPSADPARAQSPLDELRGLSCRLWPRFSAQLRERTGIDNGFIVCGGVELADPEHPDDKPPTTEWHSEGCAWEPLDRRGIEHFDPEIAPGFSSGAWLPTIAQVRNPWHLRALQAACVAVGVQLLPQWPIEQLSLIGEKVVGGEGPRGRISAAQTLITAGAWSARLLEQVGCHLDIRPIRGQIALLQTDRVGIRPMVLQGKRYLVPRTDGRILIGSTEEDVGFEPTPTAGGIAGLLEFATRLAPSLRGAKLETCWAGLRPGTLQGGPYLGRVPHCENLFLGSGHFRSGLHLSLASARLLAQLMTGQVPMMAMEAFAIGG
jgi:glycine oxidase